MGDSLRTLLKRAVAEGDITDREARKVESYTRRKNGDVQLALQVMMKHHKVAPERAKKLLHLKDEEPTSSTTRTARISRGARRSGSGSESVPDRSTAGGSMTGSGKRKKRKKKKRSMKPPMPKIGGCKLLDLLGKGAMGAVFRGHHLGFDQSVAVKLLPSDRTRNPRFVNLFLKEARALVKVSHENVVRVYNVGEEESQYFIVMELVEGSDLGDAIKSEEVLEERTVARYIREAATGLGAAHKEGLIHRDVKPDNLMLTKDGSVKVADFGLAVEAAPESKGNLKKKGIVGTPYYMPPEQADGSVADQRADVYALGCTMYHALTGQVPFKGRTLMDILVQHVNRPAPDPRLLRKELSSEISKICRKMMAKGPGDRFRSMEELAAALEKVEQGLVTKVDSVAPPVVAELPQVVRFENLAPPPLPEAPEVKRMAVGSVFTTVVLFIMVGILNIPVINQMSFQLREATATKLVALEGLRLSLAASLEDGDRFDTALAIFVSSFPEWTSEALNIRDALRLKNRTAKTRVSRLEAQNAVVSLGQQLDKLRERSEFVSAWRSLVVFPKTLVVSTPQLRDEIEGLKSSLGEDLRLKKRLALVPAKSTFQAGKERLEISPFLIEIHEVSNAEYADYLRATSSAPTPKGWKLRRAPKGAESLPIVGVSYEEAQDYARYRGRALPTVEEWVWAAEGPARSPYPWGSESADIVKRVNCRASGTGKPSAVDGYGEGEVTGRSTFGISNMSGNVAEFVTLPGGACAIQGGSFMSHPLAVTIRSFEPVSAKARRPDVGFRCVVRLKAAPKALK